MTFVMFGNINFPGQFAFSLFVKMFLDLAHCIFEAIAHKSRFIALFGDSILVVFKMTDYFCLIKHISFIYNTWLNDILPFEVFGCAESWCRKSYRSFGFLQIVVYSIPFRFLQIFVCKKVPGFEIKELHFIVVCFLLDYL